MVCVYACVFVCMFVRSKRMKKEYFLFRDYCGRKEFFDLFFLKVLVLIRIISWVYYIRKIFIIMIKVYIVILDFIEKVK